MLRCCSHTSSSGRWVEAVLKPLALHLSKHLAPQCCDLYIRCSSRAEIFRRMAMWLIERMSWGIQQRLTETTIHPSANIGGHMWTSDLRLRASHYSTKTSAPLLEVLRGFPSRLAMQDGEEAMISEESFPSKTRQEPWIRLRWKCWQGAEWD